MITDLPVRLVLQRLGGCASWRDLSAHTPRRRLDAAVAAGEVVRLSRGRYGLPDTPAAQQAAARCDGVVSHLSAAQHHRLAVLVPPLEAHVIVRVNAHPVVPDRVRLYWRNLARGDVTDGVTTVQRTVLDCAADLPFPEALALADHALRLGMVSSQLLRAAGLAWAGHRRGNVLRVVTSADRRAESGFESALRALAIEAAGPCFQPQVVVVTAAGPMRVDLADRRRRIVLEADSFEWHGQRAALRRDCRRYDELVRAGWAVLRFSWEDVTFDAEWVMAVIRDVVARQDPSLRSDREES